MEEGRQRPLDGPAAGLGIHQVLHVGPPALHDGMARQQVALVVVTQLEYREQVHVFLVEEDRVVVDAGLAQCLHEFRPDFVVAALVFLDGAGLELHAERMVHGPTSLSTMMDFAGTSTSTVPCRTRAPLNAAGFTA